MNLLNTAPSQEDYSQDLNEKLAFLNGFALNQKMSMGNDVFLRALGFSRKKHRGQLRKNGEPYLSHPVAVCVCLIHNGIWDPYILAAAILHDVMEDCGVEKAELKAIFGEFVAEIVTLVSHFSDTDLGEHFREMGKNIGAALVKIADCICNWRDYRKVNSEEKVKMKKEETEKYVFPMIRVAWEEDINYKNNLHGMAQILMDLVRI